MALRALLGLALLLAACNGGEALLADDQVERDAVAQTSTTTTPSTTTTTTEPPRVCEPVNLTADLRSVDSAESTTLQLSRAVFRCVDHLVVSTAEPEALAAAGRHALSGRALLLVVAPEPTAEQRAEIERLEPLLVTTFGISPEVLDGPWAVEPAITEETSDPPPLPDAGDHVWVVDDAGDLPSAVAPAAALVGAALVPAPTVDLRLLDDDARSRVAMAETVSLIGPYGEDADWQLEVVRTDLEIPGGGPLVFPGKRFVALYGSPYSPFLGILGETPPAESLTELQTVAAGYSTDDGVTVVPTFEIIATIASAGAGDDGDYSHELSVAELQPWVDLAAETGTYVVLDLQPGRTDFLTQAKRYEELLRLPHVGLALDPEWRLGPDQVHLRQIGTVTGAEVNTVVEWLAGLVREERLPQKLLVVHQFKLSMITERETIETPPELAVVIQMDGQGPLGTKYDTMDAITAGTDGAGWDWGWKNFYDEDSPMATPDQVLAVEPQPVFISYQ